MPRHIILSIVLAVGQQALVAQPVVIHVGGACNAEQHPGQLCPATPHAALEAVVSGRDDVNTPAQVVISAGTYRLTEPLVLTAEHSNTKFIADGPVVISGGREVCGFELGEDGLWQVQLEDDFGRFDQLYVNGRRAVRARKPNEAFFHTGTSAERQDDDRQGRYRRKTEVDEAVIRLFEDMSEDDISQVVLVAYHNWCITRRYLADVDYAGNQLVTLGRAMPHYASWPAGTRFHLENARVFLDEPGQWFCSSDGVLYYKPLADEDISTAQVIAPLAGELVSISGSAQQPAFNIRFEGFTFAHQGHVMDRAGYEPFQAAYAQSAAIKVDYSRNVEFANCEIAHIAEHGIWFAQGVVDSTISDTHIHDLGAGAIRIGTGHIAQGPGHTRRITVDNNIIRSGGRIYHDAAAIWIGQSSHNSITHNDIADFFYTGISAGWTWGYNPSAATHNNISFNRVRHLGQNLLCDMGGIYTLGPSEGTVVSNNIFHDINAYNYGGWGLYTDEGSTGIVMENNLVYNTSTGGFHQHYGRENIIRNNIFAFDKNQQLQATRVEEHLSFTFENNIVYFQTGQLLAGPWHDMKVKMDHNCYYNATDKDISFAGLSFEQWQQQHSRDLNSIIEDPGFVDAESYDFRLDDDSPAIQRGFVPFDYNKAGVRGDRQWMEKADRLPGHLH